MSQRFIPLFCLVALVVASGIVYGLKTDRWSKSEELRQACDRMDRLPEQVGDWIVEDAQLPPEETAGAGIERAIYRRYRNPRTGARISVLLECGRGGPISVHTPDVCYAAAGYKMSSAPERAGASFDGSEFLAATFVKNEALVPQKLVVIWGWSRDGSKWNAPEQPRAEYARFPSAYKIYFVKDSPLALSADSSARDFFSLFLKELAPALKP